jgi:NADPH-dependent F420 reductase
VTDPDLTHHDGRHHPPSRIGILGGTGKLGRGLAQRWATAGIEVVIGSRDADRADTRAAELTADLPATAATLRGGANAEAAAAPLVVAAIPAEGAGELVAGLADTLDGAVLLSAVSPLTFDDRGPQPSTVDSAPSAAELLAARAPGAAVVAGLHTTSSAVLGRLGTTLDEDVLLCGDDEDALATAAAAVDLLGGARAVTVGPLRLAATLEATTAVLISANQRHRTHAGLRLTGLG